MRIPAIVIGVGLTLVACGGSSGSSTATLPAPATAGSTPTTTITAVDRAVDPAPTTTTSPMTQTTEPGTAPSDAPAGKRTGLSIEQALLPDDALAPPWEPQWRQLEQQGYGAGPNQTDCGPYWALEELRGGGGGHAMWWIDGGNANHYVTRVDSNDVGRLLELAAIAEQCPTVRWSEGGAFTIESVGLDDAVGLRLTDEASGETTWFAIASFGDLVSVLDVPLWTDVDGETVDFGREELNRLASLMNERLLSADVVLLPSTSTTTTIAPPTIVPATVPPTTNPRPLPTTTVPPAVTGLGKLLLDRDDLPAGFAEPRVRPHRPDEPNADLVARCPAAVSVERIDTMLTWSAEAEGDRVEIDQIIGRAESAAEASEVVRLFGEMVACQASDVFAAEAVMSGGEISIAGADTATSLVVRPVDDSFLGEIIALAIDDVVMIVSAGTTFEAEWEGEPPLDLDLTDAVAESAVAKVRAAGS